MQKEITTKQPLLDADGNLANPGWCRRNLFIYNRENIKADKFRLKEWDFYQVSNGHQMVQINFFNISYASCATFGFVDLDTGKKFDTMFLKPLTPNSHRLNHNGDNDNYIKFTNKNKALIFRVKDGVYHLYYKSKINGRDLIADFECHKLKHHESITIATPFKEAHHFFYTNKINCLQTEGSVIYGEEKFEFSKENTYTVLDWGRGVWPHKNMWYWANGSAKIDGKIFGFELTWGFGDTSNAEETALFYDGVCHKLGSVHLETDPEMNDNWMKPWHFISDDGRLDLTMTPFYDNYSNMMPFNLLGMKSHQVHGLFNGYAVLDDGTRIEIKDMYAFCEKVYNKW
ncbi:MAG: DUF2804 domain-containing protein [Clostridium sp.]|nr:DUF2804 domain-containing protein [Clostridium sp.]